MKSQNINFERPRHLYCNSCEERWQASASILIAWNDGHVSCPACNETQENLSFVPSPSDFVLKDPKLLEAHWYHTSTNPGWPALVDDPGSRLDSQTRQRMEAMIGSGAADRWIETQRTKCLHIGTYEAAICNMLRRIGDQGNANDQFYLFQVRLRRDSKVRDGWIKDPGGLVGDSQPSKIMPGGEDITRYINDFEDRGRVSLALRTGTIEAVKRTQVMLSLINAKNSAKDKSASGPIESQELTSILELTQEIPQTVRAQFFRAARSIRDSKDTTNQAQRILDLRQTITDPHRLLTALESQSWLSA